MPRGEKSSYSPKQRRMAEHIEGSYESRGANPRRAQAIAWATVNKQTGGAKGRDAEGSTRSSKSSPRSAGSASGASKPSGGSRSSGPSSSRSTSRGSASSRSAKSSASRGRSAQTSRTAASRRATPRTGRGRSSR